MSRTAAEIRVELDALNEERVQVDTHIQERRGYLNSLNARASALEIEFQAADAIEQQAKLRGG